MTTYTPIRPYQARASRLANEIVAAMLTNRCPPDEWFSICLAADRGHPPVRGNPAARVRGAGWHRPAPVGY